MYLTSGSYLGADGFKPRPPLEPMIGHKKSLDSSSDVKVGYSTFGDSDSEWSDATFKYYPYKGKLPPHVENEIPLLGTSGSESIRKEHLYDDIENYTNNDDTSAFSHSSTFKPKPKPRRQKSSSNDSPSSLIKIDFQDGNSDLEEFRPFGKPKPPTKPKPPRPKLKPEN